MKLIDKVTEAMRAANFTDEQVATVVTTIAENIPPKTYIIAVWFLGGITALLSLGALILLKSESDLQGLWAALGAGIGALAGIFTAKE